MDVLALDTPAAYVDLDALEHNIKKMQAQSRGWGVKLRPHTKTHKIPEIARMQLEKARTALDEDVAALKAAGFDVPIVSGGSTPGAAKTTLIPATTEIRPGTYVFNDASCLANGLATLEDSALRVLVTVVSTAVPGQCVVDGGSKTFSSDATFTWARSACSRTGRTGPCTR